MNRLHPSVLSLIAVACLFSFSPSLWADELLPPPKDLLAQAKKEVDPPSKDPKDGGGAKKENSELEATDKDEPKDEPWKAAIDEAKKELNDKGAAASNLKGDTAWMLTASAFVMLMVPGLALFYGGMVRKKNVLATMMQSMAALSVVGLYWVAVGYSLAFGPSIILAPDWLTGILGDAAKGGGMVGWSNKLFFLQGVNSGDPLQGYNITVYAHCMFQGMFAIITPALISGAIAERIRFWPFCIFMIAWVTFVYCPLAHMVWAFDWFYDVSAGSADATGALPAIGATATGVLGKLGALDFAGGTVVHIAAGLAGLACALVLRRRTGYPGHTVHPNSMVLTLLGAGLLWFGWFGFNGGSATNSSGLSTSAFAATQAAAAAAGLSWVLVEWLTKGKPTALGLASGIVAGLVAVTPASGFVYIWGGLIIGLIAGVVCYLAVLLKSCLGYDDSLDAFGVHGVGGFLGAVLTGVFCYSAINLPNTDGYFAMKGLMGQPAAIEKEAKEMKEALPKLKESLGTADKAVAEFTAKPAPADEDGKKKYESELGDLKTTQAKAAQAYRNSLTSISSAVGAADLTTDLKELNAGAEKLLGERRTAALEYKKKVAELEAKKTDKTKIEEETKKLKEDWATAGKAYKAETDFISGLDVAEDKWKLTAAKDVVKKLEDAKRTPMTQVGIQFKAALFSVVFAFALSFVLAIAVQVLTLGNFSTSRKDEEIGLDQTEHGESGFDYGTAYDAIPVGAGSEPKAAKVPPGMKRFDVVLEGIDNGELMKAWSILCQPSDQPIDPDFKAIYPYVTTVQGNRFRLRGGDPAKLSGHIQKLFSKKLGKPLKVRVEE